MMRPSPIPHEHCPHGKGFCCAGRQVAIARMRGEAVAWMGVAAGCRCGFRGPLFFTARRNDEGLLGIAQRRLEEIGDLLSARSTSESTNQGEG